MKILQVNIRVNKGSASRITEQIGCKILKEGWESYIAYGRPSNPSESKLIQIGSNKDVRTHYILSLLTDSEGLHSVRSTKQLVSEIQRIKPDIIHLQNIHGHYLNYKILFEYLNSTATPVVWTLHDCWAFTGHCAHFVTAGCEKWKVECHDCPLKKSYPKSLFIDNSKRNYLLKRKLFCSNSNLHIVTVSEWLKNLVEQSFFKNTKAIVIHNGIDLDAFHPYPRLERHIFKILGVANVWGRSKGLYDFFELRKLLDKSEYEITLVGLTEEQIKSLPDGITGIKRTESIHALAELYSDSDVFLNLTYADTYPTVNLESQACGTPVITYKTGGSPESICNETGIVVPQGDLESVIKAIEGIKLKGHDYYTTACREHSITEFDKNACFDKYINLYKSIIAK